MVTPIAMYTASPKVGLDETLQILLDAARSLDPSDPEGKSVSLREAYAAVEVITPELDTFVGSEPSFASGLVAEMTKRLQQAHRRQSDYGVPEGRAYPLHEAMSRLRTSARGLLAQRDPDASPTSVAQARSAPAITPLPSPKSWADSKTYFLLLDRFEDADLTNNGKGYVKYDPESPEYSHGGDFAGVIRRLDYIAEMGFNEIWLGPVTAQFGAGAYHGYHTYDFFKVDPRLGTLADMRRLVMEAHKRGIRIKLDVVWQHTAPLIDYEAKDIRYRREGTFPWKFREQAPLLSPIDLRDADDLYHAKGVVQNWDDSDQRILGDFPTRPDEGARFLPDLNTSDPSVQKVMAQSVAYFVAQTGIDSLRLDTAGHFPPEDHKRIALRVEDAVRKLGLDNFNIVPEQFHGGWHMQEIYAKSRNNPEAPYRSTLNFPLYFGITEVFKDDRGTERLATLLKEQQNLLFPNLTYNFLDNHDRPRFLHGKDTSEGSLKAALLLLYAWPGVPTVYYGTEQSMRGGEDPHNREDMTFDRDTPLYAYVRRLNKLRDQLIELRQGRSVVLHAEDGPLFALGRVHEDRATIAVVNTRAPTRASQRIYLDQLGNVKKGDVLVDRLSGSTYKVTEHNGRPVIQTPPLAPHQCLLLTKSVPHDGQNY